MAQYLDYAGLSLYDSLIKALIEAGDSNALAEIAKRVDKEISGANGKAQIFNEADGGGAKFVNNDGTESFVGVNDGGEDGLAAQIYADKYVDGKWLGAKIDVTNGGIYYTVGDKTFGDRAVEDNEIAVKGDIKELRDLVNEITGADSDSIASISELKAAIDANADAIASLLGEGEDSIEGKIDAKVDQAVADLVGGAPEALDTLKEIVEWIGGSDVDGVDIAENLAKNANDIADNAAAIAENASAIEDVKGDVENAINMAGAAYDSASARIDALEEIIGVGGSDSEDINLLDKVADIKDRLDAIREEEDEAISEDQINGLFA